MRRGISLIAVLLIVLAVALVCLGSIPASASVMSENIGNLGDVGSAVGAVFDTSLFLSQQILIGGTEYVVQAVQDPDGAGQIRLFGNKATTNAVVLQKKFGSFRGSPFLYTIGMTTSDPGANRLTVGLGTKVGSYKHVAFVNAYANIVSDEVSDLRIPAVMPQNLGIAAGVGISFILKE